MARPYFGGFTHHPAPTDTKKYMRGECAYLALAFHDVLGFDLVAIGGEHFAARAPDGRLWDIRGGMTEAEAVDGFRPGARIEPRTRDAVIEELNTGVYSDGFFVPSRLPRAKSLVRALWAEALSPPRRPRP